jgi:1,4-alpha-glucan branching enzyme
LHHAFHVLVTGERGGYYADYPAPRDALARCLASGFAWQGESSAYRGAPRGEPSGSLPPTAFVGFLQNHDQVGNRALGERLTTLADPEAVRAATEEPFLFFSDLGPDLGRAVSEGRRQEFAGFPEFADHARRDRIPDPQAPETRERSVLDWTALEKPAHQAWLDFHRTLLALRRAEIVPLLGGGAPPAARVVPRGDTGLDVEWVFPDARVLRLAANLGAAPVAHPGPAPGWGRRLYALGVIADTWSALPAWSAVWYLREGPTQDE